MILIFVYFFKNPTILDFIRANFRQCVLILVGFHKFKTFFLIESHYLKKNRYATAIIYNFFQQYKMKKKINL